MMGLIVSLEREPGYSIKASVFYLPAKMMKSSALSKTEQAETFK